MHTQTLACWTCVEQVNVISFVFLQFSVFWCDPGHPVFWQTWRMQTYLETAFITLPVWSSWLNSNSDITSCGCSHHEYCSPEGVFIQRVECRVRPAAVLMWFFLGCFIDCPWCCQWSLGLPWLTIRGSCRRLHKLSVSVAGHGGRRLRD